MTKEMIIVTPKTKLPETHRLMTKRNIRHLAIVNKKGELVGVTMPTTDFSSHPE